MKNLILNYKNRKYLSVLLSVLLSVIFIFIITIFEFRYVAAHPPLPTEFYGSVISYNAPADSGTINAYIGSTLCGSFSIVNSGFYGVLSCLGDDPETQFIEGALEGESITFRFNSNPTTAFGDATFTYGIFKLVNITHPLVFCGDGFCDALENCASCEIDCFSCNATGNATNATSNTTSNQSGTGSGSGGGGGRGGGGGGGGSMSGGAPSGYLPTSCYEDWSCMEWSECSILGLRTRICTDKKNCQTYKSKPLEVEECSYEGNCFDSIMNCHNNTCEEGIDCGGPCPNKCSIFERPFQNISIVLPKLEIPRSVCERHVNFNDPGLWLFLLIIIIAFIVRTVYSEYCIKKLRMNQKLLPLDRSRKILSAQRKTTLFSITLLFLTIASFLYSYYFLLCPNQFMSYSWILLLLLILIPLVIHTVMKKYEYTESVQVQKERIMEDTHYQNLVGMIELENQILAEEESRLATKIYELTKNPEFNTIVENTPHIKKVYKDLVELYSRYQDKKNPVNIERDICDEIIAMDNDKSFKAILSGNAELKQIFDKLLWLHQRYQEKQELYDKLEQQGSKKLENTKSKNKD